MITYASRRLKRSISTDSDEELSDRERNFQKRSSATAKKPRKTKLSSSARKDLLSSDEWVEGLSIAPSTLRCKGCRSVVKLSNRPERPYELKNWDAHKAKCASITEKKKVRVGIVKRPEIGLVRAVKSLKYVELIWLFLQPMKGTLSDFFARKGMDMPPTSEHAEETTEIKHRTKVVSVVRTIALEPLHYLTSDSTTLKTPSITQFFPKLQGHPPPKKATVVNMCIHLSGPEYKEYIDLTCTRDFGGISLARVARQLFPYKKLGELRQFVQRGPLDLAIPPQKNPDKAPEDGNDRKSMTEWTSAERRKVDLILRSWARWEVDYIKIQRFHQIPTL